MSTWRLIGTDKIRDDTMQIRVLEQLKRNFIREITITGAYRANLIPKLRDFFPIMKCFAEVKQSFLQMTV